MIIAVPIILLALIIYLCIRYKKLARIKISTGQVIKFIHPRAGFYQLNYENKNEIVDMSRNKIFSSSNETGSEKEPPVVKCCVVCGNKNTYSIAVVLLISLVTVSPVNKKRNKQKKLIRKP